MAVPVPAPWSEPMNHSAAFTLACAAGAVADRFTLPAPNVGVGVTLMPLILGPVLVTTSVVVPIGPQLPAVSWAWMEIVCGPSASALTAYSGMVVYTASVVSSQ